ncbi:MAG: iron ABC transporter permease [Desulfomonilia bacterium]|jgi:iron complex transport system permease protein
MSRTSSFLILFFLLTCALAFGVFMGGSELPAGAIIDALIHPWQQGTIHTLIWELRIPRIIRAVIVGASLAVCGVAFQAVLRNPLAEPYTLGVSAGGALGATIAIMLGLSGLPMVGLCFTGCLMSIGAVIIMSTFRDFSTTTIILCGVVLSFLLSSVVMFIFTIATSREVHASVLWIMGSLGSVDTLSTPVLLLTVFPLILLLSLFARDMNLISLGDEKAHLLGFSPGVLKAVLLGLASLLTGVCVAVSGIIGFVGLIIPHAMRRAFGAEHQVLLFASMLAGSTFLLLCDTLSQIIIRPYELPVGVITGIAGGVFFLLYLLKASPPEVI